jgi:hypothetical protein
MDPVPRASLAVSPHATQHQTDCPSEPEQPRVLPKPCPCGGGRMIIIDTFAASQSIAPHLLRRQRQPVPIILVPGASANYKSFLCRC